MEFEVLGKLQGKQRARVCMRGGYAKAYTPEETVSYENLIKLSYKAALNDCSVAMHEGELVISIVAVYAIPKSFSKKRREEAINDRIHPTTKPDIDNVVKVVCDALNGIAYHDDAQIIELYAAKKYGLEPKLIIKINKIHDLYVSIATNNT